MSPALICTQKAVKYTRHFRELKDIRSNSPQPSLLRTDLLWIFTLTQQNTSSISQPAIRCQIIAQTAFFIAQWLLIGGHRGKGNINARVTSKCKITRLLSYFTVSLLLIATRFCCSSGPCESDFVLQPE